MIGAAVDVGSNSVHLLVAELVDGTLVPLRDESELLGLGEIVDAAGEIPADSQERLVSLLSTYRDAARASGARSVTFLGTDPFRQASNGWQVAERIEREAGIPLHVLTQREEGELTFLGVTAGRPVDGELVVVDIGGGSTEVVLYGPDRGIEVTSLETGSSRLSNEVVSHDPPTADEIEELRTRAAELTADLPAAAPQRGIFVGGTATNVVKVGPLALEAFDAVFDQICTSPAAELAPRVGVRLRRALQLAAGAALSEAILRHYGLAAGDVSDASLRDGAILAALHR